MSTECTDDTCTGQDCYTSTVAVEAPPITETPGASLIENAVETQQLNAQLVDAIATGNTDAVDQIRSNLANLSVAVDNARLNVVVNNLSDILSLGVNPIDPTAGTTVTTTTTQVDSNTGNTVVVSVQAPVSIPILNVVTAISNGSANANSSPVTTPPVVTSSANISPLNGSAVYQTLYQYQQVTCAIDANSNSSLFRLAPNYSIQFTGNLLSRNFGANDSADLANVRANVANLIPFFSNARVATNESLVSNNQNVLSNVSSLLGQTISRLALCNTRLSSNQSVLAQSLNAVQSLETTVNAHETLVARVESELSAQGTNITSMQGIIATIQSRANTDLASVQTANAALTQARANVATLSPVSALSNNIAAVYQTVVAVSGNVANMSSSLADAQSVITTSQRLLVDSNSALAAANIGSLGGTLSDQDSRAETVTTKLASSSVSASLPANLLTDIANIATLQSAQGRALSNAEANLAAMSIANASTIATLVQTHISTRSSGLTALEANMGGVGALSSNVAVLQNTTASVMTLGNSLTTSLTTANANLLDAQRLSSNIGNVLTGANITVSDLTPMIARVSSAEATLNTYVGSVASFESSDASSTQRVSVVPDCTYPTSNLASNAIAWLNTANFTMSNAQTYYGSYSLTSPAVGGGVLDVKLIPYSCFQAASGWTIESYFYFTSLAGSSNRDIFFLYDDRGVATGDGTAVNGTTSGTSTAFNLFNGYDFRLAVQASSENIVSIRVVSNPTTGAAATTTKTVTGVFSLNSWHHVALVFQDTIGLTLYVDGQNRCQVSAMNPLSGVAQTMVGVSMSSTMTLRFYNAKGSNNWKGSMNHLRISSTARYASNFTVPSVPFSWDSDTVYINPLTATNSITSGQWGVFSTKSLGTVTSAGGTPSLPKCVANTGTQGFRNGSMRMPISLLAVSNNSIGSALLAETLYITTPGKYMATFKMDAGTSVSTNREIWMECDVPPYNHHYFRSRPLGRMTYPANTSQIMQTQPVILDFTAIPLDVYGGNVALCGYISTTLLVGNYAANAGNITLLKLS